MNLFSAMGCGSSAAREEPIIDIGRYIEEYAWQFFDPEFSWKDCVLPIKQNYYLEINWNYVEIRHEICRFEKRLEECERTRSPLVLFKTVFCNDTDDEQSYTFRATRTTTSSCTVTVVKGWTIGKQRHKGYLKGEVLAQSSDIRCVILGKRLGCHEANGNYLWGLSNVTIVTNLWNLKTFSMPIGHFYHTVVVKAFLTSMFSMQ